MNETIEFDNGLRLNLDVMPGALSCAVNLCVLSGLRFEQPEQAGVSHMLEHMLFKGTHSKTARDIAETADDRGAALNAYTCKEYTCFYVRTLPDHLKDMLELLADMVDNSRLDDADLATQKGVVLEEVAMYEDIPEDQVFDLFHDSVWPDHMLGKNILGTRESISNMTAAQLRNYMAERYNPAQMVLSISGKFDVEAVKAWGAQLFGTMKAKGEGNEIITVAKFAPTLCFAPKEVEQNQMILSFPGCAGRDSKRYQAALLSTMLGGSSSSRLFQRLREELGLVYSVDFFNAHHMAEGISGISLGLSEKTQCQALKEVLEILREFPATVTQQELRRAQEQAAAGLVMSLESAAARASRMACNALLYRDFIPVEQSIAAYRSVTLEQIRDYAQELLNPEKFALCVLGKCTTNDERAMREMVKA